MIISKTVYIQPKRITKNTVLTNTQAMAQIIQFLQIQGLPFYVLSSIVNS